MFRSDTSGKGEHAMCLPAEVSRQKGTIMPYLSKKQLYEFEKQVFLTALSLSGGLSHNNMSESEMLLWKTYKGEIPKEVEDMLSTYIDDINFTEKFKEDIEKYLR